jgi:hypothetical protein
MFIVFVKENGGHRVTGMAESADEVKELVKSPELVEYIRHGKAYVMQGSISLIHPETTPELLDTKKMVTKKASYY